MTHIAWDDAYKVGNDMIDSQHQRLFELSAELHDLASSGGKNRDEVEKVMFALIEYVIFHFDNEEDLMKKIGYADMDSHVKEHRAFNDYATQLIGEFVGGKDIDLEALYSYIVDWLVQHIATVDKKLAAAV